MVSTASHVARVKHRQELEREQLEQALAAGESTFRAELGAKLKGEDDRARARMNHERTPDEVRARDEYHQRKSVEAVQRLYGKHDAKRAEMRTRHLKELEAASNTKPTAGRHPVLDRPEPHHPVAMYWSDLDAARRQAVTGVYAPYAMLRDNADADKPSDVARNRYMKGTAGERVTNITDESKVEAHLALCRQEFKELVKLAFTFERDLKAERERFAQQAAEREAMMRRHAAENSRVMAR